MFLNTNYIRIQTIKFKFKLKFIDNNIWNKLYDSFRISSI